MHLIKHAYMHAPVPVFIQQTARSTIPASEAQTALRAMQKESEDPDKQLQEELQDEENVKKDKRSRKGKGKGRGRGESRGRGRGRGRGKKQHEEVTQEVGDNESNTDTAVNDAPAETPGVAAIAVDESQAKQNEEVLDVEAEVPSEPVEPASKPGGIKRNPKRSKLKRLKALSPSSSAKKNPRVNDPQPPEETHQETAELESTAGKPVRKSVKKRRKAKKRTGHTPDMVDVEEEQEPAEAEKTEPNDELKGDCLETENKDTEDEEAEAKKKAELEVITLHAKEFL